MIRTSAPPSQGILRPEEAGKIAALVDAARMQASVSLIRALGGGWTVRVLPSEKQTLPFGPFDYGPASNN